MKKDIVETALILLHREMVVINSLPRHVSNDPDMCAPFSNRYEIILELLKNSDLAEKKEFVLEWLKKWEKGLKVQWALDKLKYAIRHIEIPKRF